eukprot:TRINITY_DN4834_c0_g1_i1.p1 TRINITY_DN4834_c0_g1~~TRINITY_DN4834_c0_g1_i1.p1  ORF type:complete len:457 (+),score=118.82 TRINITY_DN4834_c0_g1_i1:80-1450(+)
MSAARNMRLKQRSIGTRHWAGKAPVTANEYEEAVREAPTQKFGQESSVVAAGAAVETEQKVDRRLNRLATAQIVRRHSERRRERDSDEDMELESNESEDEDADTRRARVRARQQASKHAEQDRIRQSEQPVVAEEEESDDPFGNSSEESEADSDSGLSDDAFGGGKKLKPIFVSKADRDTIREQEEKEARELEKKELQKKKDKERVLETKKMLLDDLKNEEEQKKLDEKMAEGIDVGSDSDGHDDEGYDKWRIRELLRIKRDKEAREERNEAEMRAKKWENMTEFERKQEEIRIEALKKQAQEERKGKMKFMQKYYHKGAFYNDELGDVLKKYEWTDSTGRDEFDKANMPDVMQVRDFGLASRSKYTHLNDQDTSQAAPIVPRHTNWVFSDKVNPDMPGGEYGTSHMQPEFEGPKINLLGDEDQKTRWLGRARMGDGGSKSQLPQALQAQLNTEKR